MIVAPSCLASLPTNRAIIQRGLLLRDEKLAVEGREGPRYPVKEMAQDLTALVELQWTKANQSFAPPLTLSNQ
jgi:hypothetical protein